MGVDSIAIVVVAAWIAVFGMTSARVATGLDRLGPVWFAFGALLGPIAVAILRVAPPGRCRNCGTRTRGWLRICGWCHEDVTIPANTVAVVRRGPTERATSVAVVRDVGATAPRHAAARSRARARRTTVDPNSPPPTPEPLAVGPIPQPQIAPRGYLTERSRSISVPDLTLVRPLMTEAGSTSGTDGPSVVASAVYVAGNSSLEPGRRYDIVVRGDHLQILAPTEDGPPTLIVDRPIVDCQSSIVEGRLIVSEPRVRSGLVLAFMSIAGATPDALAAAIREAARASARQ